MRLSGCPLVLKGVIYASYSCNEPFFALGCVCRSLPLLRWPVTEQPHDNIDPRRCHCVPCHGGLAPMKAAPIFGGGERRSPRWLRPPGVQKKRPQSCLEVSEVSELPRSLRCASPLQLAALGGMSSHSSRRSSLGQLLAELAAAVAVLAGRSGGRQLAPRPCWCSRWSMRLGSEPRRRPIRAGRAVLAKGTGCGGLGPYDAAWCVR